VAYVGFNFCEGIKKLYYFSIRALGLLVSSPTTHTLEHNWQYAYTVVFGSPGFSLKIVYAKPKHGGAYNVVA
jgi:hypothetical protein